ncbi:MAG: type II toxin-antitoxin system HicA family toxin [Verrucomicrobia bacterium]|jgi:predicted RNA binding protein YcfA (HicA-like mRNA interferase family)|nr:type II toxin-antitoxin system HicA family toxin [Verrucomicrobiota bacterium]
MKLPRDVAGRRLVKALRRLGYNETRQTGSHIRVTPQRDGEHHEVIPDHSPVKCGTLGSILKSVARHHRMTVEDLMRILEL